MARAPLTTKIKAATIRKIHHEEIEPSEPKEEGKRAL
jgi:hypothetical protein